MQFKWNGSFEKGIARMDATHREFVEMVDVLLNCAESELTEKLAGLLEHTREHFQQEDGWMAECRFPPIQIHMGEHARVLEIMQQSLQMAEQGETNPAREIVRQLPAWFKQHAASMDNALAMHMKNTGHPAIESHE